MLTVVLIFPSLFTLLARPGFGRRSGSPFRQHPEETRWKPIPRDFSRLVLSILVSPRCLTGLTIAVARGAGNDINSRVQGVPLLGRHPCL